MHNEIYASLMTLCCLLHRHVDLFRAIAKQLSLILKKQFTMTNFGGCPESPSDFFQRSIEVLLQLVTCIV